MRIAATAASRPPGARPSGPAAEPAGAAEATASEGRTTRPAIPRGDPVKRVPNCIRPRIPAGAMARYLPRHRPFADGTFKCAAAAINMPGGRSRARN